MASILFPEPGHDQDKIQPLLGIIMISRTVSYFVLMYSQCLVLKIDPSFNHHTINIQCTLHFGTRYRFDRK